MPYYYLIASLPALREGAPPPMTLEAFESTCREQLSPADYAEWEAFRDGGGSSAWAREWTARERDLRNTLVRARAARQQVDPAPWIREGEHGSYDIQLAVEEAYARPHPLERERALERFRWQQLEAAAVPDPFGLATVLSYGARLQMATRAATRDESKGRQHLDQMLEQAKATP